MEKTGGGERQVVGLNFDSKWQERGELSHQPRLVGRVEFGTNNRLASSEDEAGNDKLVREAYEAVAAGHNFPPTEALTDDAELDKWIQRFDDDPQGMEWQRFYFDEKHRIAFLTDGDPNYHALDQIQVQLDYRTDNNTPCRISVSFPRGIEEKKLGYLDKIATKHQRYSNRVDHL
jgi:hypothetical protein